ncbi:thrombospondin type-1 domain-containing protein 7B-like isoform X2 [Mytilus californianus]|uniref:thrombospondin type-1 domain-containing protein 7B-like isoform X2 n=1 Tax=Mytilus californianus TaxID=6549 RepID=UPI00224580B9|nr:thrombospondin type-1 domain-containing protein 7B-like isoform X2 [Mytilus californianus]
MEYGILTGTASDVRHFFLVVTCLVSLSAAQYSWRPGEWSSCNARECGLNGQQDRHVSCLFQDRKGQLSYAEEENCRYLPRPISQRQCYKKCIRDQYQVTWAADTWGRCQLIPKVKTCARGMGIRYRNVTCVFKSDGKLQNDSICASFEPKPATSESCDLQCKQDCIVTPYGPWSSCDKCEKIAQTRTRIVVIPDDHGGKDCPPFSQIEPCTNCSNVYYIYLGRWSPCHTMDIPENYPTHSLIGREERSVSCIDSIGATVPYTRCKEHINLQGQIITDRQSCIIPQNCEISEWSPWQLVNSSCLLESGWTKPGLMKRERSVRKLPRGLGASCPPLVETTAVHGTSDKSRYCPRNKWLTSSWSKCLSVNGGLQCTTGMQHRKAICVEENESGDQKPVDDSLCTSPRPTISQLCSADCDWDCTVSLWSQWSDCTVTECEAYARKRRNNQKTGQRFRTREVLTRPGTNGEQCPHLSETQNCDPEPCYFWNTSSGPCSLSKIRYGKSETCGVGIKQRTATCVDKKGMRVSDDLCSSWETRPEPQVLCEIPCRYDCVTSDWGEWSECPDICETEQDVSYRPNMRSRQKTILARHGPGGTECPGERELIENKPCPTVIECAVFIWHADPWGSCELEDRNRKCGRGRQTRGVHCYNRNNQLVQDEKCTQSVKPERTRVCMIPCPRDCTLTAWSDWSSCSASCFINKDNIPTRSRQRFILQEPDNSGAPCPEVLQEVKQCIELPLCHQFQWKISNWSVCILAPTIYNCGKGLRARDIACMAQNGTDHPIEDCLKFLGPMPPIAEPCYMTCDRQCLFTDWSEWSHCIQGCSGHQFRSRELKGGPGVPDQCHNNNLYPTYQKRPCQLCESLKPTSMGEWSDCILEPVRHDYITNQPELTSSRGKRTRNTTSLDMGYICGTGKRIKVVACSNHGTGIESADKCNGAGYEEEVCLIPCPVDCEMSDWTTWSECPAKCGAGVQTRYRSIRRLPSAGGRQCPSLGASSKEVQTRLCHPECVRYVWKTKAWGTCIPHNQQICGNGTQTRFVRCYAVNRHGFTTSVASDDVCVNQRPPKMQHCYLYCLEDCVVSVWTTWTSCSKPCNHNDRQVRTREVLRYLNYNNCPEVRETKPCIKNDNCIEYYWEWSSWTTCLINNGMDNCGVGHKERYLICKNHFGHNVDSEFCEVDADPVSEPSVVSCEEVCDVDCLVSDWSSWSSCSKKCGLGVSQRERTIVEQFSRNGRPCPDMLKQKKPCFQQGCYSWTVSVWSNCTSQFGICGHGIQKRNISCMSEDGIALDPSKCSPDLHILILQTERPCTVPCPGECVMTEWTEWNKCYLSREDFSIERYRSLGVQSRSRAVLAYPKLKNTPCPDKLWEKRHCAAEEGMFFEWSTSPWNVDQHRTVWCSRSDGLKVIGGCDIEKRPPLDLRCEPVCPVQSSCNDTNICICTEGLVAQTNSIGILMACLQANVTVEKDAQETGQKKEATSIWMYAVLAAGTVFIIFVALAFYNMSEHFRSGPRPREAEDEEAAEKLNTGTIESRRENGVEREHCPNVNTHLSAPTPTNTNYLYENSTTNALWSELTEGES